MKTIVFDTYFWISLANNEDKFISVCKYCESNKIAILIHAFTLVELFRTKYKKDFSKREEIILNTPNLRYITEIPISFMHKEFLNYYYKGKTISLEQFYDNFTFKPSNREWLKIIRQFKCINLNEYDKKYNQNNILAFSKITDQFSKDIASKKVSDFLTTNNLAFSKKSFEFYEKNFKTHLGKGHDLSKYKEFQNDILGKLISTDYNSIKSWINNIINHFDLDRKVIGNLDLQTFLERAFYLKLLLHSIEDGDLNQDQSEDFIEELKMKNYDCFPGFNLVEVMKRKLLRNNSKSKTSDTFDFLGLSIAPYVDLYIVDATIADIFKQTKLKTANIISSKTFYSNYFNT